MSNPRGTDDDNGPVVDDASAPETEVIDPAAVAHAADVEPERRFTAPSGMDAGKTQIIHTAPEPATEIFAVPPGHGASPGPVAPQIIPGRGEQPKPPRRRRSWGWVIALVLVIAALAAVAILGTVLLSRDDAAAVSQEDLVRITIPSFGQTADGYVRYDERQWNDIHARVAAAVGGGEYRPGGGQRPNTPRPT